jgi:uncharacterized protein (TIGR01244 family)
MNYRTLDDKVLVSGQIGPGDMNALAEAGVTLIVNNRPDGEEPGQPASSAIEGAARAAGLDYRHIPISGGLGPEETEEMARVLEGARGKTLVFCKSGLRSAYLWALARSRRGGRGEEIMAQAEAAGFDLSPLRSVLNG